MTTASADCGCCGQRVTFSFIRMSVNFDCFRVMHMKKYISILIALLMLASCISALLVSAEGFRIGDANLDGKINIKDATHIQRYAASIIIFSDEELHFANVNGDKKVNIKDATMIQKFIAKIIGSFPADNMPEDVTTGATDNVTESVDDSTGTYEPTEATSTESENTEPSVTKPTVPEESKPTVPEQSKPTIPEESKPTIPEETNPTDPVVTKPSLDEEGFNNQIVRP